MTSARTAAAGGILPLVQTDTARSTGPLVVAVLAGLAHLVVGYFYLVGGLVTWVVPVTVASCQRLTGA